LPTFIHNPIVFHSLRNCTYRLVILLCISGKGGREISLTFFEKSKIVFRLSYPYIFITVF